MNDTYLHPYLSDWAAEKLAELRISEQKQDIGSTTGSMVMY